MKNEDEKIQKNINYNIFYYYYYYFGSEQTIINIYIWNESNSYALRMFA